MKRLELFNFEQSQVRTLLINDEPYFVGKDVAQILGYKYPADAVRNIVPETFKGVEEISTPGGKQKIVVISEAGMYKLAFQSKKPNAERFTNWIAAEVLPAIRKHGVYMTDEKAFDVVHNKNGLADLLQQAANQLKEKDIQIEEMKPKALFADSVATSKTTILVGELAKILRGNGIDIGANRLFEWLRTNGYLINRNGTDHNMPTQKSMNLGLFKIKETTINHSNGTTSISKTPKVTGKGQQYFVNVFLKQKELE